MPVVQALCMSIGGANTQFWICLLREPWGDVCTLRLFSGYFSALLPRLPLFTGLVASSRSSRARMRLCQEARGDQLFLAWFELYSLAVHCQALVASKS